MDDQGELFRGRQRECCPTCGRPWPAAEKREWTDEDREVHIAVARILVNSDLPLKYHQGVLSSKISAQINSPVRVNQREKALAEWMKRGEAAWFQISDATGIPYQNSARMTELTELGLLAHTGRMVESRYGGVCELMRCTVTRHA
jgi:hypothetical protein